MVPELHPDVVRRILDTRLFLEANLSKELSIKELARTAKMSPFHFQRIFRKVVGESAGQHLRRLRLERAALWLRHSETPITTIAFESGFASNAGFTHAFTGLYGLSPTAFRQRHEVRPFIRFRDEKRPVADADALARCPLTISLQEVPERTLAVMRFVGPTALLPTIWPKMHAWCQRRGLLHREVEFLGLHHDDWDTTRPNAYRYDAAVVVPADFQPDAEVTLYTQPGGLVACTAFEGSLLKFDRTWKQFVYDWLPASSFQFRLAHVYDVYPPELITGSMLQTILRTLTGIRATLCVPVSRDWVDGTASGR
jgi:AraC family transcriptional regulator